MMMEGTCRNWDHIMRTLFKKANRWILRCASDCQFRPHAPPCYLPINKGDGNMRSCRVKKILHTLPYRGRGYIALIAASRAQRKIFTFKGCGKLCHKP